MQENTPEIDWRFDALDVRPVLRWLAAPEGWMPTAEVRVVAGGRASRVDLYLDTDDWRFSRAGYALRIRRTARRGGCEAALERLDASATPAPRGPRELAERLEQPDPRLLRSAHGPVGERVRAVAGAKPLLPLFEVRTRRRRYSLETDGLPPAQLALDETAIHPADGESPARLRRVEIEASEAAQRALAPFVERMRAACALQPAPLGVYEAGLLSADLRPAGRRRFAGTEIEPGMTIEAVALAVLRRHFSAMLAKEPGTRLGDDPEELHDMRVATRRLRAALSLFPEALPDPILAAREELGWIGRMLGAVRDLDVQLEQLDAWLRAVPEADRAALEALRGLLDEERATARAAMLEALDSRRYEAFVARFGRLLRARRPRRPGPDSLPARAVAPDLIESRFRPVRKAGARIGPHSPAGDYHRLRIRCKRLRYALEFLADVYPGRTRPLLKRLVALQDILGRHQDADVAIARLRRLAVEHGRELEPATVFAMGEIAERYRNETLELRAQFPAAFEQATGRRWKAFRALLVEQRPSRPADGSAAPAAEAPR